ncbi:MAG TPA: amino acid adenylation domain-containing protein [Acidiferrobacterales bacterium]|nr:amino acid adenylation domain-containing protein [Acidiferrobacterales bacterium]
MNDVLKPAAELSPADKRKLLAQLLAERIDEEERSFPLSYGQKALWFFHQLVPDTSAYNVASAMRIKGRLNLAVLRSTIQALVDRHPGLRTTFSLNEGGEPVQTVHAKSSFSYIENNVAAWPWEDLYRGLVDEAHRPFDLERGPLLRVNLYVQSPEDFILLLVMNHIVVDFWSMSVLMQEFVSIYEAKNSGLEPALPALPAQFKDYVEWERALLADREGEALFKYWQEQLSGELPVLKFPSSRRRPASLADRGGVFIYKMDKHTTKPLRALAAAEGSTLFMVLLAAFQVLLYRHTGQELIPVGSPVAGRSLAKFESVVGYFVNTIVLKTSLNEGLTFRAFLAQVRHTALDAFAHQDYPFPALVERLHPSRHANYSALFQVMFNHVQPRSFEQSGAARIFLGDAGGRMHFGGLHMESFSLEQRAAHFDLTLTTYEVEDVISAQWQYNAGLFDVADVSRLAACFHTLLKGIIADPGRSIMELPLLTKQEKHRLLAEWNNKVGEVPHQCFHELFEAQAARAPDNIAVASETQALSYGELNARANRLARILVERQVGPDVVVALFSRRGVDLLTAILAIFKAGGAYLPIDPIYPAQRITQMLAHSGVRLVLAESALVPALSEVLSGISSGERPVVLTIEGLLRENQLSENLPPKSRLEHLAYVIYTSGSTGMPKGAMIEQRGMLNHLCAKISELELTVADVIAQTASQCFDISVWQYLAALLVGGQTHIVDGDTAADPLRLLRYVDDKGISILESVPSLIAEMLRGLAVSGVNRPRLQSLRWFLATGEDLPPELCRLWFSYYPHKPLLNAYGPTECSDDVTHHRILQAPDEDLVRMPIGRPIANMQVYVLDKCLEPVPIGVPGELYVGGPGVGRGYLNDPDRTAAAFIADPFSQESNGHLYKTGDWARVLDDGALEFLGRVDSQVKVRGHRIELQEIESVLARQANVGEVVVVAIGTSPDANRLIAYIVAKVKPAPTVNELRSALKERLPHYMVPSAFVFLETLPRGATGKIDRDALPAPDGVRPELDATFVSPRTDSEKRLTELWANLLNMERVGVFDNFFELGGHSLLAIQLLFRVRDIFQKDISVRGFFENPTVAGLAELIGDSTQQKTAGASITSVANLKADVILDPAITPQTFSAPAAKGSGKTLITGATGFLGSHLLFELLNETEADLYCLVRTQSPQEGMQKIQRSLKSYGLVHGKLKRRVHIIAGDLAKPLLGQSPEQFFSLAGQIDTIYHSGASVSFVLPYQALKATNVLGTEEVLRLACHGHAKSLHYVSSLAVCPLTGGPDNVVREDDDIKRVEHVLGGYAQSKWVAEGLVTIAQSRGLPVTVYRPGMISGHSRTGVWNANDFMSAILKGCMQLGAAPILSTPIEMTPVDYVSAAIVAISRQRHLQGKVFHLSNPRVIETRELVAWINARGYPLRQISFEHWLASLFSLGGELRNNALYPFVSLMCELNSEIRNSIGLALSEIRMPRYDCTNTVRALEDTSIRCPAMDENLFDIYLSYLIKEQLLDGAAGGR